MTLNKFKNSKIFALVATNLTPSPYTKLLVKCFGWKDPFHYLLFGQLAMAQGLSKTYFTTDASCEDEQSLLKVCIAVLAVANKVKPTPAQNWNWTQEWKHFMMCFNAKFSALIFKILSPLKPLKKNFRNFWSQFKCQICTCQTPIFALEFHWLLQSATESVKLAWH